jgi:hypothetical protein
MGQKAKKKKQQEESKAQKRGAPLDSPDLDASHGEKPPVPTNVGVSDTAATVEKINWASDKVKESQTGQ